MNLNSLLEAEASRDPQPVGRWLQALTVTGNQLRGGGALDQAKKAFNAPGGPASLCKQAVAGRYPFTPGSKSDIPLDDFAHLFAPGGLLDKYFADNLASFVDTSAQVWKTKAVAGVAPPVTPADLAQFLNGRRRSATCSLPAAAISRRCGSTSRRWTPTPSRSRWTSTG